MKLAVSLMLDSGAYSAWTIGGELKVEDYITFIKTYKPYLSSYVNLDTIPGSPGARRTQSSVNAAAAASYRNLQIMKDAGLSPIPVFHYGESFKWLEKLLVDGEQYIGLGGTVDLKEDLKRHWLDECFSALTDKNGVPLVKTHGFGTASWIRRYPFFSVDSTTWVLSGGNGLIYVPTQTKGSHDYSKAPIKLAISGEKSAYGNRMSFDALGPTLQAYITKWLKEEAGFELAEVRYSRENRCRTVLTYFLGAEKSMVGIKFTHSTQRFLSHRMIISRSPIQNMRGSIIYSTNLDNNQAKMLTERGARNRLLSYYELRRCDPEKIIEYIKNGGWSLDTYQPKRPLQKWDRRYMNFRRIALIKRLGETRDADETDDLAGET